MKILIASDHAGFELKEKVKQFLLDEKFDVKDMGAHVLDPSDDYPHIMVPVAMAVLKDPENTRAIIFGKSGEGEAMICNRFPGIRATVYHGRNLQVIRLSREHNDANILSFGAYFVDDVEAREAVKLWLSTEFSGDERHMRRIEMLDNIQ